VFALAFHPTVYNGASFRRNLSVVFEHEYFTSALRHELHKTMLRRRLPSKPRGNEVGDDVPMVQRPLVRVVYEKPQFGNIDAAQYCRGWASARDNSGTSFMLQDITKGGLTSRTSHGHVVMSSLTSDSRKCMEAIFEATCSTVASLSEQRKQMTLVEHGGGGGS